MVGDRKYDAEGAQICGIDALGVSYGHGTTDELEAAGFVAVVDTSAAVADVLLK
jgi:phosphoglycolate phosphatase